MTFWQKYSYNYLFTELVIRILQEIVCNFKEVDLSEYDYFIYSRCVDMLFTAKIAGITPQSNVFLEKWFTRYYVLTYKPKRLGQEINKYSLSSILNNLVHKAHPEWVFSNKTVLVRFVKLVSSALWSRIKFENEKLSDPEYQHKKLFLDQEDIHYFIEILKPYLELFTQGQTSLNYMSRCLKNLIILDWDSILEMYIFREFPNLSDLVSFRFFELLNDVVCGVILNTQTNSKYKFKFIENVILYLLEQGKALGMNFKSIISLFNHIWAVFPVLPKDWPKEVISKTHPGIDYSKHMKTLKNKNIQEYQFYKLYEKMNDYALEYFDLLKTAMNWDLSMDSSIIKGFKYLLNAMKPGSFEHLIIDLMETCHQEYSKVIIGRIINNMAARSPKQSEKILKFLLENRLFEVNDDGSWTLFSFNYDTIDYYLFILSSAAYQNKESAKLYIEKIITLFKLITEHFKEDKHKNDFQNILRAIISPFTAPSLDYPWILSLSRWESIECQANLWKNIGILDEKDFEVSFQMFNEKDIDVVIYAINDHILPWIEDIAHKNSDKNNIKTVLKILGEILKDLTLLFHQKMAQILKT
jgi:hypothetical protein